MPNPGPRIAVFLKAPRAGLVKTRLADDIGADAAAALYRTMAEARLDAALATGWPITIWYAPSDGGNDMMEWLGPDWHYLPQPDGDLGAKMATAFAATPDRPVVLIGADCPGLTTEILRQAASALDRAPVVLGPAEDGGYYLIGGRHPLPDLFSRMPWGTEAILAETRRRLRADGTDWIELPVLRDVDTLADARAAGLLT